MSVESQNQLKLLLAQRDAIKGELNSFNTFLTTYDPQKDIIELQLRQKRLTSNFQKFDSICDNLDVLDDSEASKGVRFELLNEYYKVDSKAHDLISKAFRDFGVVSNEQQEIADRGVLNESVDNGGGATPSRASSVINTHDGNHSTSTNVIKRKLKLPNATVPPFDGTYENWLSFKNTFIEYIHNRDDITDLGKYQCLESALRGEALQKIKLFWVSEKNYTKAWNHLERVYGNSRLQLTWHLNLLLNLPKQDVKNPKSLELLADKAILNVESLKSLGVDVSQEIIVEILQEKLDPATKLDWDKMLKRDEFPTLDSLTEFMYQRAALQSLTNNATQSDTKSISEPPAKVRKTNEKNSARSFVTSDRKCIAFSQEQHALYQCAKFKEMSVNDRVKMVKNAKLCVNCMRNHGKSECRFGNCKTCGKKHNTMLHYPRTSKNENKNETNSEKSA